MDSIQLIEECTMSTMKELSCQVLQMPRKSRALLADLLLESLDDAPSRGYEKEWLAEARRRDGEMDSGKAQGITHEELMRQLSPVPKCDV